MNRRFDYARFLNATSLAEYRNALRRAEKERAESRQRALAAQAAEANDSQTRIEAWEQLHALALPYSPEHALVALIARQTRLTTAQVHEEQRRRAEPLRHD